MEMSLLIQTYGDFQWIIYGKEYCQQKLLRIQVPFIIVIFIFNW